MGYSFLASRGQLILHSPFETGKTIITYQTLHPIPRASRTFLFQDADAQDDYGNQFSVFRFMKKVYFLTAIKTLFPPVSLSCNKKI